MNKKIYTLFVSLILISTTQTSFATYGIQTKTTGCIANQILPDPECSPGAILTTDPKVICVSGYTKTVRNVSEATKKKVFKEYGIPYTQRSNYEVDHIISLELGGSNDIANLYPESYLIKNGARTKDIFENYLHKQICNGKMDVAEAQRQISSDWFTNYQTEMLHVVTTKSKPVVENKVTPKTTGINTTSVIPATVIVPAIVKQVVTNPTPTTNVSTTGPEVKKSTSGICHARGTTYYDRTSNYTAFPSIDDCLNSGGRLPAK
jgi:hypothetical protein